ncbi:HEAT repeat domain-containing protein [Campylobacter concisus]|uniref:HEAT repeat domain-containing protein n=1 Tax=Campylobacter concisus TaxID=199 RepID=UPI000CD8415D|nr:HEAT repeat domain-containing protein [Campylobacter concisus]MBS5810178.1 HEAT repeat domain-containing protein [Campylobacter concisus]
MLSLNDLEKEYLGLKKENFPDSKRIKFIANLGASDEIAYHYELICKEWQEGGQLNFESSFNRHGGAGLEFLFEHLAKKSDQKLKIETIYLMAQILSKSKHRDFYAAFCDRLIPQIISFLGTNDAPRRKLIIALGWVGTLEQIDILISEMLGSKDSLCRAWVAASLMQMSFHRVSQESLRDKTKAAFLQSISSEKELYACAVMIEAAQILFGKKWISSSTAQNQEAEKIEKARKMAVRFLGRD